LIDYLRTHAHGSIYAETIPPPVCQQIITSMTIIMGEDGTTDGFYFFYILKYTRGSKLIIIKIGQDRIKKLYENSYYFHKRMKELGFLVYGELGSPVVPVSVYNPGRLAYYFLPPFLPFNSIIKSINK